MRLIHTKTLVLHEFFDPIPPYSILSHTWGEGEVNFQAMKAMKTPDSLSKGWSKITSACLKAANDGWEYIWIDTCCIDKTNLAELSESINSMFRYYSEAQICYVYLSDVKWTELEHRHGIEMSGYDQLACSRWFERGWTLQELLAPRCLIFLNAGWQDIGTRETHLELIENVTKIEAKHLRDFRIENACVATKLSWASERKTTRLEDRAYSLMGLLDINMPLLYGEGHKAFRRLLLEIVRNYSDETIFCWDFRGYDFRFPLLPDLPDEYPRNLLSWSFTENVSAFTMTNVGLNLDAEVFRMEDGVTAMVPLNVALVEKKKEGDIKSRLVLQLERVADTETCYRRSGPIIERSKLDGDKYQSLGRQTILIYDYHGLSREASLRERDLYPCVVHLTYPEEVYILDVFTNPPSNDFDDFSTILTSAGGLSRIVSGIREDEIQLSRRNHVLMTLALCIQGKFSMFAIHIAVSEGKTPIYGIWNSPSSFADSYITLTEKGPNIFHWGGLHWVSKSNLETTARSKQLQHTVSIEMRPNPVGSYYELVGGDESPLRKFTMNITTTPLETEIRRHRNAQIAGVGVGSLFRDRAAFRHPKDRSITTEAALPKFSNHGKTLDIADDGSVTVRPSIGRGG